MSYNLLMTLATIVFAIFVAYLYIFTRSQSTFMKYWGFAWMAYCFSLLCVVMYTGVQSDYLLEIRKIMDMGNLLFILYASYALLHTKTPAYWYRFSLYMVLLAFICMYYKLDLLSYYLPVSIFQVIITITASYNILIKWQAERSSRIISTIVFVSWGLFKSLAPIYEIFNANGPASTYGIELLFSNILCFSVFILYIISINNENEFSRDLYKEVVQKSKDIIFYYEFKPYPSFRYITNSIQTMTNYPVKSFYEDPNFFMTLIDPSSRENLLEVFNEKNTNEGTYIIKMLNKRSEIYWAEFYRNVELNDKGEVVYMLCTVRDVTEMQTAQMEQIKATQSRNMLLSYISHELRTPITSIAGYMTAINDGVLSGDDEVSEALDIITNKTTTLKTLIDDLDQLTKLETNQFTFEFMLTSVDELVSQLITNHYTDATTVHNFEVIINADISQLSNYWVIIDSVRINQVFTNLVTNAYKYAQDNHKMEWSFIIDQAEDHLIISVRDYGRGIKSKHLGNIFDKFYRADYADNTNKQIEGRGLGLTLCKEMIHAHQGEIFVESVYGEGSTFTFIIPLYKED